MRLISHCKTIFKVCWSKTWRPKKTSLANIFQKILLSNTLLRKPFYAKILNVPERYQEEFIDLISSDCANTNFDSLPVNQFWIKQLLLYPNLADYMLRIRMFFTSTSSTCMREVTFHRYFSDNSMLKTTYVVLYPK